MAQSPGFLIALDVMLLYIILGPVVLLAIYILFDYFAKTGKGRKKPQKENKDAALWTIGDVWKNF